MTRLSQEKAPILEALEEFKRMRLVPFDVPGHKRGRGNRELTDFLGEKCLTVDVNSMKQLDNLCHPVGAIKAAEGWRPKPSAQTTPSLLSTVPPRQSRR